MSPDPLDDPKSPPRIILPGGSPAGEPQRGERRIILPPGTETSEHPELPTHPVLRALQIVPVRDGDRDLLVVTDPLGVMPAPVALRIEALEILRLLDGGMSLNDLAAAVARGSKDIRAAGRVRDFVAELDRMLMLDSPRFREAYAEMREAYHRLEIRQAALEGITYPADPRALDTLLAGHFAAAETMRADTKTIAPGPRAAADAPPRALLAPHLDPRRAGPAIARAYLELERDGAPIGPGARATEEAAAGTRGAGGEAGTRDGGAEKKRKPSGPSPPARLVVVGVGHSLLDDRFALTRKHFETPFGKLPCDTEFVDAVASQLGDDAYSGELAHRDEHSIEFQALYLKHRFGPEPPRIVPLLCGGFHAGDEGEPPRGQDSLERLIRAVRETERRLGGRTVYVAAVDLSHVGTRFGDPPADERTLREVEDKDHAALEAARRGDAEGWSQAIAAHQDSTRVCGWTATYVMLRCAEPGEGRLLHYEQSVEDGGSVVSLATMAWP